MRRLFLLALLLPGLSPCKAADARDIEFFEQHVRPLLVKHCYRCHSTQGKSRGGLRLDSKSGWEKGGDSGPALQPGHPDKSLLIQAVRYTGDRLKMPPSGKLSDAQIDILVRWVKIGAPDPRSGGSIVKPDPTLGRSHWAFQPLRSVTIPPDTDAWPRGEIDRLLRVRQQGAGLNPVPDADRLTLLRRVTFDLTGLPPTPAEVDAFLADDSRHAWEKVVERLLASPHFGEHWGRHWLDLARYAETTGSTNDLFLINAWRYRDYVVRAFNQDRPYNRFVTEQIAGDLLPFENLDQRDEQRLATGFLALGIHDYDRPDPRVRLDQIDEQIDVVSRAILGLTISCARCHDHKYDPISQKEYYALAGIFSSTDIRKTVVYTRGKHTLVRVALGLPLQGYRQEPVDEFIRLQETLYAGRRPVVHMGWALNKARAALKLTKDPAESAKRKAEVEHLEKTIADRQSASARAAQQLRTFGALPPMALGVCDGTRPHDQVLRIRGEEDQKGAVVPRGFPAVILPGKAPAINPRQSGRLELARWLTTPDNPLTARVMVNRIWYYLFGEGLVASLDNFGINGEAPSHPELLDWLARRFMDDGWSIKKTIRRLVLSRAYQLRVMPTAAADRIDADNRLLWRMNRRRLSAEALRDAILSFSGELDRTPGQRSLIADHGPGAMRFHRAAVHFDSVKRSLYLPQPRGLSAEVLALFDGADPKEVISRRDVTTVPSQALFLLNSPFVLRQARAAAQRLLEDRDLADDDVRIDRAFRLALGRPATAADVRIAHAFLARYDPRGNEKLAPPRKLKGKKKKQAIEPVVAVGVADSPRLRAWSGLCQVLICSSEFRYLH